VRLELISGTAAADNSDGVNSIVLGQLNLTSAAVAHPRIEAGIVDDCDIIVSKSALQAESLAYTLMHELGHCLGLGHNHTNYGAVMGYSRSNYSLSLGADDMAGVAYLYPEPGGKAPSELVGCSQVQARATAAAPLGSLLLLFTPLLALLRRRSALLGLCIVFFAAADLASADDSEEPDHPMDPIAEDFVADEFAADDDELELTQEEIREHFTYGGALSIGVASPWQTAGLAGLMKLGPSWYLSGAVGGGGFRIHGRDQGRQFVMKSQAQSAIFGTRWFPMLRAPFFIEGLLGLGLWSGKMRPEGSDPVNDTEKSRLTAAFNASGLVYGINVGFVWAWSNRTYLEYSLQRVGAAQLMSRNFTDSTPESQRLVEQGIESPQSWGFANIRLGWFI
jgi:hypothetical protein